LTFSEQYRQYLDKINQSTKFGQGVPYAQGGKDPREVRGFWKDAQEQIAQGKRLVFPNRPEGLQKKPAHWTTVRLPTAEDYWKQGREGAFLPGATGTYKEMQDELKLAQYPGAISILETGVPYYGGKNDVEERHLRAQAAIEYGERYIDDITFDSDTMLQMENSSNLAQRMGTAISAYEKKAQSMSTKQDEFASNSAYQWIFDNVGKHYHTGRQKVMDLVEAGLANGYRLFSGDQEYEAAWAEADAAMAQEVVGHFTHLTGQMGDTSATRSVYNPVTQLHGANMYADVAENLFWQWLPWNWGKPDTVHSLDVTKTLTFLEEHPGMSAPVAQGSYVDDYWWTMAEEWLNPFDWAVDKAFDIIFPPLMARTAIRATARFLPRVARKGAKVTPEVGKIMSKMDETARLGGITDEAYQTIRSEGLVGAFVKDMDDTIGASAEWADEFGLLTHTQETKAALTKEEVQHGVRWVLDSLGHDGNPERFYARLETVSKLASKDKLEVDSALRELSKIGNFDFWFSQTGQTAAYVLNKAMDIPASEVDDLYKTIAKTDSTSKKVATLMAWADDKAQEVTEGMFPTLTDFVKKGRKLPEGKEYLKAASKFHDQAQKVYGPVTRFFSNWYLGRTPGYAVRNMTQNYAQTIYDLGVGSIDGWKHIDDAFDWALADEIIGYGDNVAKEMGELFVGMNRDLSGIEGVMGKTLKEGAESIFDTKLDARWHSSNAERWAGVNIFGDQYPKMMKKQLRGNLKRQYMSMGLDKQTAQLFEDSILQFNGNLGKATEHVEKIVADGFWRDATLRNLSPDLQNKAAAYRYDRKIYEWLDESDNFEDFATKVDAYTNDLLESAEAMVRREGQAGAVAGISHNPGVSANAVMDGAAPQAVHDAYNSTRAANKYTNAQVGNAIQTLREESVNGLVALGYSEDEARVLFQKLTSEVDLVVEGDKAAAVGKINGFDFIEGKKFSPEEIWNKQLYKQQDEIGNRYADRRDILERFNDDPDEMSGNLKKFWDEHMVDDFGEYAGQDWWEVKRANYRSFMLEDRGFWNDWTSQNYNMARTVADSVVPKLADMGIQMAPVEHMFSKAHKAVTDGEKYQRWVPQAMIDHALNVARRNKSESRRLWTFATEYARMYGIETFFMKDGKEFLNHKKLVSTINKQLGTEFPHLNAMTGIKESQIRDAMKANSLDLYMRIVDDPESAMNLIMKAIDPGEFSNKRVLERLTRNELQELKRFNNLLQTEDPRAVREFQQAIQARNSLPSVASAKNHDAYNELARLTEEADNDIAKAGDALLELLGERQVTGEARKFSNTAENFAKMEPQELGEFVAEAPEEELMELLDWVKTQDEELWRQFGRQARSRRTVSAEQAEDVAKYYDPATYDETLDENARNLINRIRDSDVELQKHAKKVGRLIDDSVQENTTWVTKAFDRSQVDANDFIHMWGGEDAPTAARVMHESADNITKFADDLKNGFRGQWDNIVRMDSAKGKKMLDDLDSVKDVSDGMLRESRLGAMKSVKETRDFILHNYADRRNFDTLLAYIYPYHFWHTRNGAKWMKRIAERPGMARAYTRYKERMERINADQPEWFRHNTRFTGFLGFDEDNPLLVNLEALVSPMYQVIKEPFYDPDKRDTAFARLLDDAGRVMSVHTLYPILYGAMRYVQGDKDPAAKWMSRLIPQTKVTTAFTSVVAKKFGLDHWERGVELDPLIGLQGAINAGDPSAYFSAFDPYEQKRVAMGYQALVKEGRYTEEEIVDAVMSDDPNHPITVEAHGIAQSKKNMGDMFSFIGGPGFQIRNEDERKIMAMDEEFRNLFEGSEYMDKDETAQLWQVMRSKYPEYFNTVMLTRKDRDVREKSFVYNVMSRVPPGQSGQVYEAVGLDYEDVQKFYDSKGEYLETMPEPDRLKFMAGIYEISTVAAFPEAGTQAEWTEVKARYGNMRDELEERYGEGTFAARDYFFELLREDKDKAYSFLDANPDVGFLMSDETQWKMNDPLMTKYYASYDNARAMLNSEMYDRLEAQFPNGRRMNDEFWAAKSAGKKVKASEELKAYWDNKHALEEIYGATLVSWGRHLPDTGAVEFPKRFDPNEPPEDLSRGAQALSEAELDKADKPVQYSWTWEEWERVMDPTTARLVQDWAFRGADLGEDAENNLEYLLESMRIDKDEALYLIQQAAQRSGAEFYGPENPPWWEGQ
jgi:hypothetical protein